MLADFLYNLATHLNLGQTKLGYYIFIYLINQARRTSWENRIERSKMRKTGGGEGRNRGWGWLEQYNLRQAWVISDLLLG